MNAEMEDLVRAEALQLAELIPQGALEPADLVAEGWLAVVASPHLRGGALRLRVRGAVQDALRREWRALGHVATTVRWPVYWPRPGDGNVRVRRLSRPRCCDCGRVREEYQRRCAPCRDARRLVLQRGYNLRYYQRKRGEACASS